ncbi:cobalamin biosynthesis protein CobD [Rubrobacter tropicus]|uniref:Cobalamin biosynthesis protein CobD n=1 Tax=Rubrobacter tropicus TaxID=2653851 RepID=A0A6G8Q8M3_9ACTN|nr:adenosylcobinamide-phosphate synthase CbiB [Rubrobacter tropicus]QIN82821.1 cobalamin biosynthesis protein CobD [Rubrobacter tropicus]
MRQTYGPAVAAALLLDALLGEPPEALHPTVWMGRAISAYENRALRLKNPRDRRIAGVLLAGSLPALVFLCARSVLRFTPRGLRPVVEVALGSTTISMRGLASAAESVQRELDGGDVDAARSRVGEFVGRDTADLTPRGVSRAAVESVAENASDGVIGPMLYGFLFGAPGALAYKAVNTIDSMVGYRRGPYLELGWAGARLDDLANLAPARLTVLAVAAASGAPARTITTALRYGPLSSSPNAGYVEAAFAGALGLRLGGTNVYGGVGRPGALLGEGRPPQAGDIGRAVRLMRRLCAFLALTMLLVEGARRG